MLALAGPRLEGRPVTLVHANFDELPDVLGRLGVAAVDGVLADLGVCSDQLDQAERGFSFGQPAALDMRLDSGPPGETAASLLRRLNERDLADLFWQYGEERFSRRIARRIVETRRLQPLQTTDQLAELVRRCVPRPRPGGRKKPPIDPATRVFQALRIAVNDELGALDRLLAALPSCLRPGGRAAIISFHSLEDRRVKTAFRDRTRWREWTRKPVQAGEEEVTRNPRARTRQAARGRSPGPAGATDDPGRGRGPEEIRFADLETGGRPHAPPLLARGAWKVTRKSQYGWMVVGGILCLCGGVVALKLREGNPAVAQSEPAPAPMTAAADDPPPPPPDMVKDKSVSRSSGGMKELTPTEMLPPIISPTTDSPPLPAPLPTPPGPPPVGPNDPPAADVAKAPPPTTLEAPTPPPPSPSAAPAAAPPSEPLPNPQEEKEDKGAVPPLPPDVKAKEPPTARLDSAAASRTARFPGTGDREVHAAGRRPGRRTAAGRDGADSVLSGAE